MEKIKLFLKSSAVTTTDASNKRQQQPDSTSSTSTLATTVTAKTKIELTLEQSQQGVSNDVLILRFEDGNPARRILELYLITGLDDGVAASFQ
ncbi:hypothetical protein Tco_1474885 [Tanacetum coccineum]